MNSDPEFGEMLNIAEDDSIRQSSLYRDPTRKQLGEEPFAKTNLLSLSNLRNINISQKRNGRMKDLRSWYSNTILTILITVWTFAVIENTMNSNTSGDILTVEGESVTVRVGLFPPFANQSQHSTLAPDEDHLLVSRCQNGDLNAFSQLIDRHELRVRSIVSRILLPSSDPKYLQLAADIDDLSQDIFVQAWRALPRFRGEARFSTWLYRIAVNRALKEYNHRRRGSGKVQGEPVSEDLLRFLAALHPDPHATELDPEGLFQKRARDNALRSAIDDLPEKQRLVVLLHYFEECSCEEIASIAGCSVGTVWSRLHYACRRLQERLSWMDPRSGN